MNSSSSVEKLIQEVGQDLGRPPEAMEPFVKLLVHENWLETKESLLALTATDWEKLKLPLRFEQCLKEKIADKTEVKTESKPSGDTSGHSNEPRTKAPLRDNSKDDSKDKETESICFETNYTEPESEIPPLLTVIENFRRLVPRESQPSALKTIFQLIHGVLADPDAPKKRKVRLENQTFCQNVGQYPEALKILNTIGFAEEPWDWGEGPVPSLILRNAIISRLMDSHHLLSQIAKDIEMDVPPLPSNRFNPYSSSVTAATNSVLSRVSADAREAESKVIAEKIKQREHLLMTGGAEKDIPLQPSVFTLEEMRRIDRIDAMKIHGVTLTAADENASPSLSSAEILRLKEIMGDGPSFKSRAKQQLEVLEKRSVFSQCTVRVIFPDKWVLQLFFLPNHTLAHVYATLESFLHPDFAINKTAKWYLCETPPFRRFNPKKTLYDEGLVPRCLLHFRLEEGSSRSDSLSCLKDGIVKMHRRQVPELPAELLKPQQESVSKTGKSTSPMPAWLNRRSSHSRKKK